MSLYNMINGVQPATFFILPMLGKHPDEYPRFRDCFVGKMKTDWERKNMGVPIKAHGEEDCISIYTRVGGGNREDYAEEISELRKMPGYIEDYDDDFDSTFATFVFEIPDKFKTDFTKLKEDNLFGTSQEYKDMLYRVYPKLKDEFDKIFANKTEIPQPQQIDITPDLGAVERAKKEME